MPLFKNKKAEDKNNKKISSTKKTAKPAASMKELYGGKDGKQSKLSKDTVKKNNPSSLAAKILVKPLVTEKSSIMAASGKYTFSVSDKANKIEVEKAFFEVYGVKPLKVNMVNVLGKKKRHGRVIGKRKDWKKAIVTLPEGETVQIYEGI